MTTGARGSSITAAIDAAIERVVDDFESNDRALRLDVLRALSVQTQVAFETTKIRQRLDRHPVVMDLIHGHSSVYKSLMEKLVVDSSSCCYDEKRNVVMKTDVRWTLGSPRKRRKRRKKSGRRMEEKPCMVTKYRYERVREEEETLVQFSIVVAFGDDEVMPRELLYFEMACDSPYPKSYYEEKRDLVSEENDDEENGGGEESKEEKEAELDEEQGDGEAFGEELREFRFRHDVLVDMGEWMGAGKEEVNPVDVVGFFVALPVHEDEWLVDERVCEILFQGGMGADSSDDECSEKDEDNGGDEAEL